MKKNALSVAVATSVAALTMATAQAAMYQNHEGTGEVLLFPFYDAENGNATNMHIVNTSATETKAVKVRFLEYKASYEVLDFNLYLSPRDHFAFGVVMDPNGTGGAIVTSDNSCTVPALGSPNGDFAGTTVENADGSVTRTQPFVNYEFLKFKDGGVSVPFVDADISRTLRGHVEVIEMGVLQNGGLSNPPLATELARRYEDHAAHDADGVPANCAALSAAFVSGDWRPVAGNPNLPATITAPTGGLYGLAYHINVEDAAAYGFEPAAIASWSDAAVHANPGTINPSLGSTAERDAVIFNSNNGTASTITYSTGNDAVSALFMTNRISNDVQLNSAIGGMTDWVTTFPTKREYVTVGYGPNPAPIPPFTTPYAGATLNASQTAYVEALSCEGVLVTSTDREEASRTGGTIFSPPPPTAQGNVICDEQHTAAWGTGSASALNVERGLFNLGFGYTEGWATYAFNGANNFLCDANDANCLLGLPAMGFAAYKYANGSTGSVMMNYGHVADHKTQTAFSATAVTQPSS